MKKKQLVALILCAVMLLTNGAFAQVVQAATLEEPTTKEGTVTVGDVDYSYDVVLPAGYDADKDGINYPTIYVMPEDGLGAYPEKMADMISDVMAGSNGIASILVFPEYTEDCDFYAVTNEIVADVDADYNTIATPAARAIMGTEVGGYMAYIQAVTSDGTTLSKSPITFASVASICGDFVSENNIWSEYGSVYDLMNGLMDKSAIYIYMGMKASLQNYYTYLDCATEHEYSAMEGSTNDIASIVMKKAAYSGMLHAIPETDHEFTARYGEYDEAFLKESINRVINRFSREFTTGMTAGTFTITPQAAAASVKEITANYTVNVGGLYASFSNEASNAKITVTMTDPTTGAVLETKSEEKEVNADGQVTGSFTLPNTVNGKSTTVTLSADVLGYGTVIGSQSLVRIQATGTEPEEQLIDLMGDWKFKAYKKYSDKNPHELDKVEDVTKDIWSQWGTVQPALASWEDEFDPSFKEVTTSSYAWYVREFEIPADFVKGDFILTLGKVDEGDEAFINGVRVGATGINEEGLYDGSNPWDVERVYKVSSDILKYGETNTIAVRVCNSQGGGGWYTGPVGIYTQAAYNKVLGLPSTFASEEITDTILDFVAKQNEFLADKDFDAYADTVAPGYFHSGYDKDRYLEKVKGYITGEGEVKVEDKNAYVFDVDGNYLYQADRVLTKADGTVENISVQDYYIVNGDQVAMYGDHSRFYVDTYESGFGATAQGMEEGSVADMTYRIYLPEGYYESDKRYPVMYLLHQYNSTSKSYEIDNVHGLLDQGIAAGDVREMIVVIPDSGKTDFWRGDWEKMVTEDLVPFINETYRTIADARFAGTAGCSMGGHGAYQIGLSNPDKFSSIISFFGALNMGNSPTIAAGASAEHLQYFTHYFICGNRDEWGFGSDASGMDDILREKDVDHVFLIENGGHNSAFYVPHFLEAFAYISENMYTAPDAIKDTVSGTLSVDADTKGIEFKVNAEIKDAIKTYLNVIPAYDENAEDETLAMTIPVVVKVEQNGKVVYSETITTEVTGAAKVEFEDTLKASLHFDPTKAYTVSAVAAVLDKEVVLGTYEVKETIAEESTGVKVEGIVEGEVIVEEVAKDSEIYKEFEADVEKGYTLVTVYDIEVEGDIISGKVTVSIPVGTEYNGRKAIVYHILSDTRMEEFNVVVKDGKVSVEVSEFSPFAVAIKDVAEGGIEAPKTGDITDVWPYLATLMFGLAVVLYGKQKKYI